MAEGDINYLKNNNVDCEITIDGKPQRATLVVSANSEAVENITTSQSFELAIQKGEIEGYSAVAKFGENPDIDTGTTPEDIWEYGGEYTFDPDNTAPIVSLVSDSALDDQMVTVQGSDIDGTFVSQDLELTGTTRLALTTPLWRVNRVFNTDDSDLAGTVYCYTGTGNVPDPTEIRAIVDNGNNQTLMAIYTIPDKKVGFVYRGEFGASRSQTAGQIQAGYFIRNFGKVFRIQKRINVTNAGSSIYQDPLTFVAVISGKSDIKLTIESVSANNSGVFGTFELALADESLFSDEYLAAIGQPGY